MNKTSFRIFICFTLTSAAIAVILLCMNFLGYAYIISDSEGERVPKRTLAQISENLTRTEDGFYLSKDVIPEGYWCVLIDGNGDVIWSENKPDDVPTHFSLNDVAKMTHWFLNDYPVYVRVEDYGLITLGMPKNAVGKYEMNFSMRWFDTLPQRLLVILSVNLCFAALLACVFGTGLYRRLKILTAGIENLRYEKRVKLPERGIFREISANINAASDSIERKNAALAAREAARANWISGISHDIRTPLAVMVGYSDELSRSENLSADERKKAETITAQGIKIKKLIEDLNLISSLEYDMQPSNKKQVKICPLIRKVATDILNGNTAERCEIELDLRNEKTTVFADESLIERALCNLIGNSAAHNENGCKITVSEYEKGGTAYINVEDNGKGAPQEVLDNISKIPKSAHGLGLPMAARIVRVHGGRLTAKNENGLKIKIELPTA